MGCLVGIGALGLAAGAVWLGQALGASATVLVASAAVVLVVCAFPVARWGHRGFCGGGNTDLSLYVVIVGVGAALAAPRLAASGACQEEEAHLAWVASAQAAFRSVQGTYATGAAVLAADGDGSFAVSPEVVIEISGVTDSTYLATVLHPRCRRDGEVRGRAIDQQGTVR